MAVRALTRAFPGLQVEQVGEEAEWRRALEQPRFDAAIVDYQLHWTTGLELLHRLQRHWPVYTGEGWRRRKDGSRF